MLLGCAAPCIKNIAQHCTQHANLFRHSQHTALLSFLKYCQTTMVSWSLSHFPPCWLTSRHCNWLITLLWWQLPWWTTPDSLFPPMKPASPDSKAWMSLQQTLCVSSVDTESFSAATVGFVMHHRGNNMTQVPHRNVYKQPWMCFVRLSKTSADALVFPAPDSRCS